jgi:hypothetical protein
MRAPETPLEFMLAAMRDMNQPKQFRAAVLRDPTRSTGTAMFAAIQTAAMSLSAEGQCRSGRRSTRSICATPSQIRELGDLLYVRRRRGRAPHRDIRALLEWRSDRDIIQEDR